MTEKYSFPHSFGSIPYHLQKIKPFPCKFTFYTKRLTNHSNDVFQDVVIFDAIFGFMTKNIHAQNI